MEKIIINYTTEGEAVSDQAIRLELPILYRKWDNIDESFISKQVQGQLNKTSVVTLHLQNYTNKEIEEKLSLSKGCVAQIIYRYKMEIKNNE